MTQYLLDTNIVLRLSNADDPQHELATSAISTLLAKENECSVVMQVLIEFWVVATRPAKVNGLGWTTSQTRTIIAQLLQRFEVLDEGADLLPIWLDLVTDNQISGKRTHDARLAAVMLASGVEHILTLNPKDFNGIPGITVIHPSEVVGDQQD